MKTRQSKPLVCVVLVLFLASLACSLVKPGEVTPTAIQETAEPIALGSTPADSPTEEPPTPTPEESGAISSLEDLEKAVVRIEVEGSYQDPYEGWQINIGSGGTAFIIDPSGIAVTNNHVVTGAALVKVWIKGENKPRNARILGVSECSDLAVIDIEGDGYPYLEWRQDEIKAGLEVFTAGYPISATGAQFSLTEGIISKADEPLSMQTASVDEVIEHTAKVNPGNSGGPLVDSSARVLGVNFAYNQLDQNYAISRLEAIPLIEELRTGKDVDSIGVNGVMVAGELKGVPITGLWVRSVKSGSPADQARLQAGDIITEIEGHILVEETLEGYCSVIRARKPSDVMGITVIRSGTMAELTGQVNGRELEVSGFLGLGASTDVQGAAVEDWILDAIRAVGLEPNQGTVQWIQNRPIILVTEAYMGVTNEVLDPDLRAADFLLQADITWETKGGLAGCGFVFRSDQNLEQGKHYILAIRRLSGFPSWDIERYDRGQWQQTLGNKVLRADGLRDKNGNTNTLTLLAEGSSFFVYLNGIRLGVLSDSTLNEGVLAFQAWQESGKTICTFSNAFLWVPEQ